MSYFKKITQLTWVGSSVGGIAGTPNLVRGIGWGTSNKSVNLSELGLKEISEAGRSTRICAKLDEEGNLVGLALGESGAGWWSIQRVGDEENAKIGQGLDECGSLESMMDNKPEQNKATGAKTEDCQEKFGSQLKSSGNKAEVLKKLIECMNEKKENLLKRKESKLGWHRVGKEYKIPLDGILKVGKGWTWHQKQIKVN